jgi:TonB family protein
MIVFLVFLGSSHGHSSERSDAFQMISEGRAQARTGRYREALDKLQAARSLAEQSGQRFAAAIASSNIAEVYRLQGNTLEALNHFYQALRIYSEIGHQIGIGITRQRIEETLPQPEKPLERTVPKTAGQVETKTLPGREKRINEAIERIRNRLKTQQREPETNAPIPPRESRATPSPTNITPSQDTNSVLALGTRHPAYPAYLKRVKDRIVNTWNYPKQASQNKEKGNVDLEFTILKPGNVQRVRVLRSSGSGSLDQAAIRAVRAASPFDPIPAETGLAEIRIRFSFSYTLGKE